MGNLISGNDSDNSKSEFKTAYFKTITKNMTIAYNQNFNSYRNQSISLHQKDFVTVITNQTFDKSMNNVDYYVDWKAYLLYFLKNDAKNGHIWSSAVYNQLRQSNSSLPVNNNKYLSDFFFNEFKIITCPKVIKNKNSKTNQTLTVNDLSVSEDFDMNNKNRYKMNISSNFMGSIVSLYNNDTSAPAESPSIQYKKNKSLINEYILVFKRHLTDPNHPINYVIKIFCEHFMSYVQNKLKYLHEQQDQDDYEQVIANETEEIILNLQSFIVEMQVVVKLFYARTICLEFFKDEKDEMINLICSLVFNMNNVYNTMERVFRMKYHKQLEQFEIKLNLFETVNPQDVGISELFCLNEITKQYQMKKKKEMKNNDNNKNKGMNEDIRYSNRELLHVSSDSTKLLSLRADKRKLQLQNAEDNRPYAIAINFFKTIQDYKVPFEKLIVMASVSAEITECVDNFWNGYNDLIDRSKLTISSDDLMSIFVYLIIKSQMNDLMIHLAFIRYFTTPSTKSTMMGYYFTTFEGSVNFLMEFNSLEDLINKGKKENENDKEEEEEDNNNNNMELIEH